MASANDDDDASSVVFNFNGVPNVVDLDFPDYESDDTLLDDFALPTPEVIFLRTQSRHSVAEDGIFTRLKSFSYNCRTYKPGKTVELTDGDFLRITAIVRDPTNEAVHFKGIAFRRNKDLGGLLEFKRNEVTLLLTSDKDDPRDVYHQSIRVVQLDEVVKIRELVKTNLPFPRVSFREIDPNWQNQGKDFLMAHARLVCRTKYVQLTKIEGCLQVLDQSEADEFYSIDPKELRFNFRGETENGGAWARWLEGEKDFDLNELRRSQDIRHPHVHASNTTSDERVRRYTFGDAFCGAGGASRGAKAAGLRVDWGFDFDPAAITSYSKNFYRTRCEAIAAHDFAATIKEDFRVDILHLSPPCQTFSPYHVHIGQNDELNSATFFAIEELLRKIKPRIVTLEETFGLSRLEKHKDWFKAMIQIFTKLGFSIRWKVFNLCDFGLPQPRMRLFVLASCPGEELPEFPPRTHCTTTDLSQFPHLQPYTTVNSAIIRIPNGFSLHNPDQLPRIDKSPYDGNVPLRRTICCAGNQDYHPSGLRNFTLREFACLQGFPLEHEFGPTRIRKQIGNAVPPNVAKILFDHIRRHLLRVDGLA